VAVLRAATASIAVQIPVPLSCRAIAFDFAGAARDASRRVVAASGSLLDDSPLLAEAGRESLA